MDIIIVSILLFIIIGIIIALVFFYIDYTALKDTIITKETALNAKFDNYSSTSNITSNLLTSQSKSIINLINPKLWDTNSNFDTMNAFSRENSNSIHNLSNDFIEVNSNLNYMFGIGIDTEPNSRFPNEQIFKYNITDNVSDFSLMKQTTINGGLTIKGLTKMCDINDQNCFSFSNLDNNLNLNNDNNLSYLNINTKTRLNNNLYSCDSSGTNCFSFSNLGNNLDINSDNNTLSYLNINTKTKLNNNLYSCDSDGQNCYTGINADGKYSFHKMQPNADDTPDKVYSIEDNLLNINKNKLIFEDTIEDGVTNKKFRIRKCPVGGNKVCYESLNEAGEWEFAQDVE
jgi:hypothetical protein